MRTAIGGFASLALVLGSSTLLVSQGPPSQRLAVPGAEALHRGGCGHMGRAGHLRTSNLRQRHVHTCALDVG
jgi:hypothetical protein